MQVTPTCIKRGRPMLKTPRTPEEIAERVKKHNMIRRMKVRKQKLEIDPFYDIHDLIYQLARDNNVDVTAELKQTVVAHIMDLLSQERDETLDHVRTQSALVSAL